MKKQLLSTVLFTAITLLSTATNAKDTPANTCPFQPSLLLATQDSLNNLGNWNLYDILEEDFNNNMYNLYLEVSLGEDVFKELHTVQVVGDKYRCVNSPLLVAGNTKATKRGS